MKLKNIILMFVGLILFTLSCNGQPRSDYKLTWYPDSLSTDYIVFVEEGTSPDPADYTLQDGMDYKKSGVEGFIESTTTDTFYVLSQLVNDGKYLVYGVVGVSADSLPGAMGVGSPYKKAAVPSKILVLPPIRLDD